MKLKFKVGDKVRIKSIDWYNKNKNNNGDIRSIDIGYAYFTRSMSQYCGKVAVIVKKDTAYWYEIDIDNNANGWTDDMFEDMSVEIATENKLKHKVGDVIKIKSKWWFDDRSSRDIFFINKMYRYCSSTAHITGIFGDSYHIDIDENKNLWTDEMFYPEPKTSNNGSYDVNERTMYSDNVSSPSHYTWLKEKCGIEVIDITRHMDFDLGNALKYILRSERKKEQGMSDKEKAIEDLEKAIFYIKDKIKIIKEQ